MYTFEIVKDRWTPSTPWYAIVRGNDNFFIKAGGFRTKSQAQEQIDSWNETLRLMSARIPVAPNFNKVPA